MVGFSKSDKSLSSSDYMAAGATSGIITRFICQPLDVIKIRFQLQVEPVKHGSETSKYTSSLQAARTISAEEGIRGLWKGHNPGQLLSILYGMCQFGSFEKLTKFGKENFGLEKSPQFHFICGAISGVVGTVVSYPFDVLRTRFVAQGTNQVYSNIYDGVVKMLKTEGLTALYKGLTPTLLQVAPHAGAQFGFYNIFSSVVQNIPFTHGKDSKLNLSGSMVSGSLAGLAAKTVVYPFDLIRKRLEFQGFQQARNGYGQNFCCRSMTHCIVKTYTNEGIAGIFKGLSPSLFKAGVTSALHFGVYEQACRAIATARQRT